jgi:hypothetical protein
MVIKRFKKWFNRPKSYYTVPYRYYIELDPDKASKTKGGQYAIVYREKLMFVDHKNIQWSEEENQLTKEEALKVVESTQGIKEIKGDFKDK